MSLKAVLPRLTHALINGDTSNLINDTVFLRVWCLYVKLLGLMQENRQSIQSFYQLQMKTIQKLQKKCIKCVEFDFNGQYAISKYYRQPYRTDQ